MRPLTLTDFCDAEGSTLTLNHPDPEDEPLPSTEEKRLVEVEDNATNSEDDGALPDVSSGEGVDIESR